MEPNGEALETRRRHRDFYLTLAERASAAWTTEQETALFDELATEQENLRAALAWSEQQGDAEQFVRLTTALRLFWEARGQFEEGGRWMGEALSRRAEAPPTVRAHLLTSAAQMATYLNDFAQATDLLDEAETICTPIGDAFGVAEITAHRAYLAATRGELHEGARLHRRAYEQWQALGDLGRAADSLNGMGLMALLLGDHARAAASFQEALALHRQHGNQRGIADNLLSLGFLAFQTGDVANALPLLAEALDLFAGELYQPLLARTIEAITFTAAVRGLAAPAATLFGAVEAFRERIGIPMPPAYHHLYRQALDAIHAALDEVHCSAAWEEGRSLAIEQAIERARALCR